ncbi:MAG TPA: nuclear transport factor 2 family protein [Vicinamibacterales bacterium]|nr:nuclear transport factor 2 family protein [Vicinamibacterales bacterium]
MNRRAIMTAVAVLALAGAGRAEAQDAQAEKTILAAERAVHEALMKHDLATFKKHVPAESWAVDPMMGRVQTSEFLKVFDTFAKDLTITTWDLTDSKVIWIDPNTAVHTYKWTGSGTFQGKPIPGTVWSSTVWTKRKGQWTAMFHQESPTEGTPAPKK